MPNYASTDDLIARFKSALDVAHMTNNEDTGEPDELILEDAIFQAESEINSYLGVKYLIPIPFDSSSDSGLEQHLRSMTLNLAVEALCARDNNVPEWLVRQAEITREWLVKASVGEVVLNTPVTPATTTSRQPLIAYGFGDAASSSNRMCNQSGFNNI